MAGRDEERNRAARKELDDLGGDAYRLDDGRVRVVIPFEGLELYADGYDLLSAFEKLRRKLCRY